MKYDTNTIKKVSAILYSSMHNDDSDLPKDEYDHEAVLLIERLTRPTSQDIASLLRDIYSESFDAEYSVEEFNAIAGKIERVLADEAS